METDLASYYDSIIALSLMFILGLTYHQLILRPLKFLVDKTETMIDDYIFVAIKTPGKVSIWANGLYYALKLSPHADQAHLFVDTLKCVQLLCLLWFCFRLCDYKQDEDEADGLIHYLLKARNIEHADTIGNIASALIRILLIVLAIGLIIDTMGYNLSAFIASLSVGTAAVAFAAKDTFANIFSSLIILIDKPFKEGEWIVTKNIEGVVKSITIRSVSLFTFEGETVYVPSAMLLNDLVVNKTRSDRKRIHLFYKLALENDKAAIEKMIEEIYNHIIEREDIILGENFIRVGLREITDISQNLEISCYTGFSDYTDVKEHMKVVTSINVFVVEKLKEYEIKLALEGNKNLINIGQPPV